MTGLLAASSLLFTAFLIQAREVPPSVPVTVVHLGDTVTMKCSVSEEKIGLIYWYKLNFVYLIQTIAAGTYDEMSLKGEFDTDLRFKVSKAGSDYFLTIEHVSKEDEAFYFCQVGSAYKMTIRNSTVLAVNEDDREQQTPVYVEQRPEAALTAPGDPVDIQCSLLSRHTQNAAQCPGGHSVYWFRSGSGRFNASIVYIHKSSSDEKSCVYNFSKTIQDSSDAGTYYCAVVRCGEILFGEGTRVETKQLDLVVLILGSLLVLCVTVIAVLVFSRD